jgi:hypothetical protein
MTASNTLAHVVPHPADCQQIPDVMRAFIAVLESVAPIMNGAGLGEPGLSVQLAELVDLCGEIKKQSEQIDAVWRMVPKVHTRVKTEYPAYAALLEIGEKKSLSTMQNVLLAHVFIAIWRGVGGGDGEPIPHSNLQHVFLEFRRPHLWCSGLSDIDASAPAQCYESLKCLEKTAKDNRDPIAKHIAPIRILLGFSLGKEFPRERGQDSGAGESEKLVQTSGGYNREAKGARTFTVEIITDDETDHGEIILAHSVPRPSDGDDLENTIRNAERHALPGVDAIENVIYATALTLPKSQKVHGEKYSTAQDRGVSNQLRRNAQTLPNQWDRPTEYELYVLWDEISNPSEHDLPAALVIQLVLLTDRPIDIVLDAQLKCRAVDLPETTESGRVYLCQEIAVWQGQVPRPERIRQIEPALERSLVPTVPGVRLPIVKALFDTLTKYLGTDPKAWRGSLFPSTEKTALADRTDALLKRIKKDTGARLTMKRIERALFNKIVDGGGDLVEAVYISGRQPTSGQHNGIYYHCAYEADLQEVYLTTLSKLFPEFKDSVKPVREWGCTNRRVGSPYCPTASWVKQLVVDLKQNFDEVSRRPIVKTTLAQIHNAYTLYTVFLLFYATGYRSVLAPVSRTTDIDLDSRYMVIADKTGDNYSHARLIPLPEVFVAHWEHYLNHRKRVINLMGSYLDLPDPGHVLFFISTQDKQKPRALLLKPVTISKYALGIYDAPLNLSRHYLRSEFGHRQLTGSTIDAFMGHWVPGKEPMARFSSLSPVAFRDSIIPVLDEMLAEMGWVAMRGVSN